ncbi:DUF4468 domain-containing protein [Hymenobacter negativus]|uniref:DUF4468 domain-containing protein n=1 Tax=Hymenobacter negativus TaxID=2795026 RepID=A0ABS3QI92_9BACT|nr:DUF4468 domain-containing protein [Hymenobacter negativus]MBO2010743.1 DUF4468 domain-containing protein [Hymenobacter negativus]
MKPQHPIAFLCCVAGMARGQAPTAFPLDKTTRRICYSAVVPMAGASQADLHARAFAWASSKAPAGPPPVVIQEPGTEVITADGAQPFAYTFPFTNHGTRLPQPNTVNMVLHYTVKLAVREGRYRYEVTDFVFEYPVAKPLSSSKRPVEDDLIKTHAINEDGGNMLEAERKSFAAAAAKLQVQLKEKMNTPVLKSEEQ